MGDVFQRHLGSMTGLLAGQWCSDPLRHRPGQALTVYVCCKKCGGVFEIDRNRIARDGGVVPAWACESPRCGFKSFLTLEGWAQPVFDVTDVKP